MELPEVWKHSEVSEATYDQWRAQFGGMKADDVKRLKELEAENVKLKRIVADQLLENQALREVNRGRMKDQVLEVVEVMSGGAWRFQSAIVCS
jgi:hypothetical protein